MFKVILGLWLLAESHFAIHTFPEENKMYIEISSCVKMYFDNFLTQLEVYIKNNKNYRRAINNN